MIESVLFRNDIVIKKSDIHGYGIFAAKKIEKGEMIEECPVILTHVTHDSILRNYVFSWDKDIYAVALGYGSLYNHVSDPNATFKRNKDLNLLIIRAARIIMLDEEIYINYGSEWFSHRSKEVAGPKKS